MAAEMAASDRKHLDRLVILVWLAVAAGLLILVLDPDAGSTTEATLGITAAISGLATAVLVIAALIYAQVKNLWKYVPTPIRVVMWMPFGVDIEITPWNLISQPFKA
jgi:hypothetical protein